MTPGKNPASATPRRKRVTKKLVSPLTNPIAIAKTPHVSMMRANQRRAPTLERMRLLGTSPMK